MEKRCLILHAVLLLVLSLEHYNAYSRTMLLSLASSLGLPLRVLADDEVRVARGLSQLVKNAPIDEATQKKLEENRSSKKWKVGLASAPGATITGVVGGLAAPLAAVSIGGLLGGPGIGNAAAAGLLGTAAENMVIVGSLFGIFGARGTGKMMEQYVRDLQDFAFRPFRGSLGDDETEIGRVGIETRRFRVTVVIDGWLTKMHETAGPWRILGSHSEIYALRWEVEALSKLGASLEMIMRSAAWSLARHEILAVAGDTLKALPVTAEADTMRRHTSPVFRCLLQNSWPASLLKTSKIIDNPWNVGMVRAEKAGAVLADIILNKVHGERGVTLVGYSLGARVVYSCLMSLAERRAFGLVENAVLMGVPAPSDRRVWCAIRSVVTGRLVNVFSGNDYMLGFLYRTSSVQYGVAGLQHIENVPDVENVAVSDKVSNHFRYQYLVGSILKHIGWEDVDKSQVAKDEKALQCLEEQRREQGRRRDAVELGIKEEKEFDEGVQMTGADGALTGTEQGAVRTRFRKAKKAKGRKR